MITRARAKARYGFLKWKKLIEKPLEPQFTESEKRMKFYISLWNLKVLFLKFFKCTNDPFVGKQRKNKKTKQRSSEKKNDSGKKTQ